MALQSRIPEFVAKLEAAVREAEQAGAELVAESARARVPIDKGDLKEAIHTEETVDGVLVVAGGKAGTDRDVFYGHMVEHGTTHSAPQPFLVPALEENRETIIALTSDAIRRAT